MSREVDSKLDQAVSLVKRRSETPLQTLERYRATRPELKGEKMTYAGRLDPMAEGVLVALIGEANKRREEYTGLDKDYEFEFMLGVDTDTHDVLGKIISTKDSSVTEEKVAKALTKYKGTFTQKYPMYSSKVVDGVPLFEYARQGKINHVLVPEHEVTVSSIEFVGSRKVSAEELRKSMYAWIEAVKGDFRQKEILKFWDTFFAAHKGEMTIYKGKVSCGSGFYVRQLVSDLGRDLGTGAVTISILRTRVGEYGLDDSIKI